MKKKLKWIIPLAVVILIAIGILTLVLRYRSSGDVLLSAVNSTTYEDTGTTLFQVREKGARFLTLLDGTSTDAVFSPNGRYFAFTTWQNGSETLLYDAHRPRKPILRWEDRLRGLQPLDDGSLLYLQDGDLHHSQRGLLAENISALGPVSPDGSSVYCFLGVEQNRADLCRLTISDGSLTTLLENAQSTSLQLTQGEDGQDIVICAQKHTYEFTAYDLVHDALADADAASTDEDARKRNDIREQLKAERLSETNYTIYRIVGETREALAEGSLFDYFCDPLTGMVVHRLGRLFTEPVDILALNGTHIPSDNNWYCTYQGTRTALEELQGITGTDVLSVQFSGDGQLAIRVLDDALYLRSLESGTLGPAQVLAKDTLFFAFVRRTDGTALYFQENYTLYCRAAGQTKAIHQGVWTTYLPCRRLPDGTNQLIGDMVYVRAYATRLSGKKPPATLSQIITWPDSELYLLQGGEQTLIATIGNVYFSPQSALPDGSLLCEAANLWRVLGPNRDEKLGVSTRFCYLDNSHCESFLVFVY